MADLSVLKVLCKNYQLDEALAFSKQFDFAFPDQFLEAAPTLLFIFGELNHTEDIQILKARIFQLAAEQYPSCLIWYLLGRFEYQERKLGIALKHFEKCQSMAVLSEHRALALIGLASIHFSLGQFSESDALLRQVMDLSQDMNTRISALIWRTNALISQGRSAEAMIVLRNSYDLARDDRNVYFMIQTKISEMEFQMQEVRPDLAYHAIQAALKLLPETQLGKTRTRVLALLEKLPRKNDQKGFDLVSSEGRMQLILPDGRAIDLARQHLLMNLLQLLGAEPRAPISKEQICRGLWNKAYHPLEDDNRIFATVRRLRMTLEDTASKPQFILQTDKGYLLNPDYSFRFYNYLLPASQDFVRASGRSKENQDEKPQTAEL